MTTDIKELLPCPFCGETEEIYHAGFIHCDACGAEGPAYQEDYRAAWNRRTPVELSAQTAVKTEQPSLSDREAFEAEYSEEYRQKLEQTIAKQDITEIMWMVWNRARALLAQRQDSDKEPLDQKWAVWYDGSEGGEPAYCRCNGIELYNYEDEAKRVCPRPAYTPKPVFIYAAIANGAPK